MSLQIFPTATVDTAAIEQQVADAKAAAVAAHDLAVTADAKAANARQMVLNRDPRLGSLEDVAARFATEIARTDQIHAELQAGVDAANARAMVAGPAGVAGPQGPAGSNGTNGSKGDAGATGATGPSGTATLALASRPIGALALGGNTTLVLPLSRTMTNTNYEVQFAHSAVVALANVTYSNIVKTTTQVSVKVTSVGLALLAGTVVCVAY